MLDRENERFQILLFSNVVYLGSQEKKCKEAKTRTEKSNRNSESNGILAFVLLSDFHC